MAAADVIHILARALLLCVQPRLICSKNGPEFIAHAIQRYLQTVSAGTLYIPVGSRSESGFA